ncbi:MAG: hypothetical protein AABW54_03525 [Candidatus Micrarchaeota archaeon]
MATIYEESHEELSEFVSWFNRHKGFNPLVIGGWAVYHYNPYFESKDIDVIFEHPRKAWDPMLMEYFGAHGYQWLDKDKHALVPGAPNLSLVQTFRKKAGGEYIDVDACSASDPNLFHNPAYRGKEIPYALSVERSVKVTIARGKADYRVPRIEVLLLYKLKAYDDRDYRLKHAAAPKDVEYLTSKRDKDGADVMALLDKKHCKQPVDFGELNRLVDALQVRPMVRETVRRVLANQASLRQYGQLTLEELSAELHGLLS